jgi:hypothetical protein
VWYIAGLGTVLWGVRRCINPQPEYLPVGADTFFTNCRPFSLGLVNLALSRPLRVSWTGVYEHFLEKMARKAENRRQSTVDVVLGRKKDATI